MCCCISLGPNRGRQTSRVAVCDNSRVSAPTGDGRWPRVPTQPHPQRSAASELLSEWILKAEARAGLPKLDGGTCHPYRRKWKSERSHHPVKAVAVAGGWTDIPTMLRSYDHPHDADVLAVTSEPRKRRDLSIAMRAEASM